MENVIKLIHDIFSMDFDVIIPVSGNIIAVIVGFLLFSVRYFTFNHKRKKYEKREKKARAKKQPGTGRPEIEKTEGVAETPYKMAKDKERSTL